jgi:hypothetical protein
VFGDGAGGEEGGSWWLLWLLGLEAEGWSTGGV